MSLFEKKTKKMYADRKPEPALFNVPSGGDPFGPEKEVTLRQHQRKVQKFGRSTRPYIIACIVVWAIVAGVIAYVVPTYLNKGKKSQFL